LTYQLYPVDATFEKIEKWRKLHEEHPEIPFPEEAIKSGNWYEVGDEILKLELKFGSAVTDHIQDGKGKFDGEIDDQTK